MASKEQSNEKHAEIHLPYFKQGDDLGHFLTQNKNDPSAAMKDHASMLKYAAKQLEQVAEYLDEHNIKLNVQADTHCIFIDGPTAAIDELIKMDLASPDPFEDEEEEFDDEDFEESEEDCYEDPHED
jgi:uncharacterized protein YciI